MMHILGLGWFILKDQISNIPTIILNNEDE